MQTKTHKVPHQHMLYRHKNWKYSTRLIIGGWLNKSWYSHMTESYTDTGNRMPLHWLIPNQFLSTSWTQISHTAVKLCYTALQPNSKSLKEEKISISPSASNNFANRCRTDTCWFIDFKAWYDGSIFARDAGVLQFLETGKHETRSKMSSCSWTLWGALRFC